MKLYVQVILKNGRAIACLICASSQPGPPRESHRLCRGAACMLTREAHLTTPNNLTAPNGITLTSAQETVYPGREFSPPARWNANIRQAQRPLAPRHTAEPPLIKSHPYFHQLPSALVLVALPTGRHRVWHFTPITGYEQPMTTL